MVQMAESEREKRGVRQSQYQPQSSAGSSRTSRPIPTNDDVNCFSDSWEIANYYNIGLVPREYAAFEDYRWDLIMQGCGPETILVHNRCDRKSETSTFAAKSTNIDGDVSVQRTQPLDRCSFQRERMVGSKSRLELLRRRNYSSRFSSRR